MTNRAQKSRKKSSDGSNTYRGPRLNGQQKAAMRRAAREVTGQYPLRFWAQWTTRSFGWWSLVVNGKFSEIAPCRRDLEEVKWALKRARDEDKMRSGIRVALDEARRRMMSTVESLDDVERTIKTLGR